MGWASERRRQLRCGIAFRRIQLGLNEKDALGEISPSEIGISEVGPDKVRHSQVRASQVRSNETCAPQVGASQVRTFEFGPNEISTSIIFLLAPNFCSHQFACTQ